VPEAEPEQDFVAVSDAELETVDVALAVPEYDEVAEALDEALAVLDADEVDQPADEELAVFVADGQTEVAGEGMGLHTFGGGNTKPRHCCLLASAVPSTAHTPVATV
jgi:hypothetical protein